MTAEDKDALIARLQEENNNLKTIIWMLPGNVYWKSTDLTYLGCNKNVADLLNFTTLDQIAGFTDIQLLGPELGKRVGKVDVQVIKTQKEKSLEEIGFDSMRNEVTYLTQKKPMFDKNGHIVGILGVSFDITERKKNEEKLKIAKQKAETANRVKSQFLAMISHELRTPLTSILGFANLIEQPALPSDKKQEYTQHIIHSGAYLLSLINSLLDYNKLETNKLDMVLLPLNLKELIANTINMLSSNAKLKNLPVSFNYDENVPQHVVSNSRALNQILINLIGNAIKFTEHGEISVTVKCLKTTSKCAILQIAVKDSGIGIAPKDLKHIFKSFYQSGDAYTRNTTLTGTGLGLAIVEKLVKLLNGKIEVESNLGEGSTFYLTVNFNTVSRDNTPWLPYAGTVKILVLQDDLKRNFIDSLLANSIYETVSSDEMLGQLNSAQQNLRPYDILMIDSQLKGIDPKSILQLVRAQNNIHQPLLVLLDREPANEKRFYGEVYLDPNVADISDFQMNLKLAWENWQAQASKHPLKLQSSRQFSVLLVEDNPLIQIIHKSMLEELGCVVDVADSAAQAMEILNNNHDILFVDIGLSDITGFELIRKIRQQRSIVAHVPIIVLTGYSEEEEREHCLRVGANDVSVKPISKDTLEKILDRYIKK